MTATTIEWTEHVWNPIVGCSLVSPGCTNCYAMRMAARIEAMDVSERNMPKPPTHYTGTTKRVKGKAVWTGKVALAPEHIFTAPLHWEKPRRIFINSMGDLFHEAVPDEWILRVLDVIRRTSYDGGSNCGTIRGEHTYQLLTKRAARMASFMPRLRFDGRDDRGLYLSDEGKRPVVLKNLWLGVSAERQQEWNERCEHLGATPATIRYVSVEPMLGPIDCGNAFDPPPDGSPYQPIDWVICGGESGPGARPMHPEWGRSLRNQCHAAGVPFFFKQWGEWTPHKVMPGGDLGADLRAGLVRIVHPSGRDDVEILRESGGARQTVLRAGKKAAGRLLDGKEHNEMPKVQS